MKEYGISGNLAERLKADFGRETRPHERLKLYAEYVEWLKSGRKTTTIRIESGKLRYPASETLQLVETVPADKSYEKPIGSVTFEKIVIKRFGDLDDGDAKRDGFSSKEELRSALQEIFGAIPEDELVSIYHIKSAKFDGGA